MKYLILVSCVVVFTFGYLDVQASGWQPSAEYTQIPIWPGTVPDSQIINGAENVSMTKELYGGKPCTVVKNVTQPTMTVYTPKTTNTGIAIIVFPGGGYKKLAIDLEGTEICDLN
jgi:hypothetical protein